MNHVAGISLVTGRETKLNFMVPDLGSAVALPPSISTSSPFILSFIMNENTCMTRIVYSERELIYSNI